LSKISKNYFPNSHLDGRNDLGYGRSSLQFSKPRMSGDSYPYTKVTDSDAEVDEEDIEMVSDKMREPRDYDAIPHHDPFYYVAGNTKLSERASTSISPFPNMYKSRDGHLGSTIGPYQSHQYGFKSDALRVDGSSNWASYTRDEEDEEDIYNLEDVAEKMLREYVSLILMEHHEKVKHNS